MGMCAKKYFDMKRISHHQSSQLNIQNYSEKNIHCLSIVIITKLLHG